MKLKIIKIIALTSISVLSIFFSYKLAFYIGEKYFFDKLFYQKSVTFGYDYMWFERKSTHDPRYKDMDVLAEAIEGKSSKVLGISSDSTHFRVAAIGDSFVYGQGVRNEDRFPVVLETQLNQVRPSTVYSFAEPGDSLLDNYVKFVLAKKVFHPDLYIITLLQNDLTLDSWNNKLIEKYPQETEIYNELATACPNQKSFMYGSSDLTWTQIVNQEYMPSISPEYNNVCIADQIAKRIKQSGEKVLFFAFDGDMLNQDPETMDDTTQKDVQLTKTIISTMQNNNLPVIYPKNFEYKKVSEKEGHPGAETHKVYAQTLFNEITQNKIWRFKQ